MWGGPSILSRGLIGAKSSGQSLLIDVLTLESIGASLEREGGIQLDAALGEECGRKRTRRPHSRRGDRGRSVSHPPCSLGRAGRIETLTTKAAALLLPVATSRSPSVSAAITSAAGGGTLVGPAARERRLRRAQLCQRNEGTLHGRAASAPRRQALPSRDLAFGLGVMLRPCPVCLWPLNKGCLES